MASLNENGMPRNATPKKKKFLAAYAVSGNVTQSAEIADVWPKTIYRWQKSDPDFAASMEEAAECAADRLEEEARFRATEGLRRYKFDKDGKPVIDPITGEPYFEYQRSDVLLMFLLKGLRPEKYRELRESRVKAEVEHTGPVRVIERSDWYDNDAHDRLADGVT